MFLFSEVNRLDVEGLLLGVYRDRACDLITANHYAHSVPSGKTHYFAYRTALVAYSIPANQFIGKYLLGFQADVWELTRLWAPDGHDKNLLTQAISASVRWFKESEPKVVALVSYADPNVGHEGGIYRAASWLYTGQSEDGRYYVDGEGQVVARRKFHSGERSMTKQEIEAMGYTELTRPGKHRFVRGLTRQARKCLRRRWVERESERTE